MLYKKILLSIALLGPIISNAMEIVQLPSPELLQQRLCENGFDQLAKDTAFIEKFADKKMLPHDVATSIPHLVHDYYNQAKSTLTADKKEQNLSNSAALINMICVKEIIECILHDHQEALKNFHIQPILTYYTFTTIQLPNSKILEERLRQAGFNDLVDYSTIINDLGDKKVIPAIMAAQLLRRFLMPCIIAMGKDTQEFTHGCIDHEKEPNKRIALVQLLLQDHPEEFKKLKDYHELILELKEDLR